MPNFDMNGELLAPPQTKHYSLVGTAFDYLLRFYLKRLNPDATTREWVAEHIFEMIDNEKYWAAHEDIKSIANDPIRREKINKILIKARQIYNEYLETGNLNDNAIKTCLLLAQLDPIFRAGFVDPNIGSIDAGDFSDLKNLITLVNPDIFKSKKICVLNPVFGQASELIGGADTDLFIDDTLIDIKTTKNLEFTRRYFNQILGYYILFEIGRMTGTPPTTKIEFVGIYYSRYGLLYKIPVIEIIAKSGMSNFIEWFKNRAEKERELHAKKKDAVDVIDEWIKKEMGEGKTLQEILNSSIQRK